MGGIGLSTSVSMRWSCSTRAMRGEVSLAWARSLAVALTQRTPAQKLVGMMPRGVSKRPLPPYDPHDLIARLHDPRDWRATVAHGANRLRQFGIPGAPCLIFWRRVACLA